MLGAGRDPGAVEKGDAPGFLLVLTLIALLALLPFTGCGGDNPPEKTLSDLGSRIGEANVTDTDFSGLLSEFTAPEYGQSTDPGLANYQLYLTARAAQISLNEPEPPDLVEVISDKSGDSAQVSFVFSRKEGIFAVADISRIDVELVESDLPRPWLIRKITLSR